MRIVKQVLKEARCSVESYDVMLGRKHVMVQSIASQNDLLFRSAELMHLLEVTESVDESAGIIASYLPRLLPSCQAACICITTRATSSNSKWARAVSRASRTSSRRSIAGRCGAAVRACLRQADGLVCRHTADAQVDRLCLLLVTQGNTVGCITVTPDARDIPPAGPKIGDTAAAGDKCPKIGCCQCNNGGKGAGVLGCWAASGSSCAKANACLRQSSFHRKRFGKSCAVCSESYASSQPTTWTLLDRRSKVRVKQGFTLAPADTQSGTAVVPTAGISAEPVGNGTFRSNRRALPCVGLVAVPGRRCARWYTVVCPGRTSSGGNLQISAA